MPDPKSNEEFQNLSERKKENAHLLAQMRHSDPRELYPWHKVNIPTIIPSNLRNIIDHKFGDLNQKWLTKRAETMIKRSGAKDLISDPKNEINRVLDFGGGKGHILQELIKKNSNIKTTSIDAAGYVSEKVADSEEGKKMDSVFGKAEKMPIKDNSVELATAYFVFQELEDDSDADDNQWEKVLDEMIRVTKDSGKIIIVDEPPQEDSQKEGLVARAKNILRNLKVSRFNLHDGEYWRNLFEKKGLKIVDKKEFRDDDKEISEENPAQFFSYILEKAKKDAE